MKINVISWIECYGWTADRTGGKAHLGRGRINKAKVERSAYGKGEAPCAALRGEARAALHDEAGYRSTPETRAAGREAAILAIAAARGESVETVRARFAAKARA